MTGGRHHPAGRGRLLVLGVTVLVLFVAAEITGRLLERYAGYMPRRRGVFLAPNPYLRSALVPGVRYRSGPFEIDVDELGFRGDEVPIRKPPGSFRIFAMGESSTFGWKGARTHRDAWPALLEAKLRAAYPDRGITVVNSGVPGWTSVESRINFIFRIAALEPDAILLYHGNNDIGWSWAPDVETKTMYIRSMARSGDTWWNRLLEHSYVYMDLRLRLEILERMSKERRDEPDPAALRMLRRTIEGTIAEAERLHVKVAIATFAHALDEGGAPGEFDADERALGVPAADRFFERLTHQGVRKSFPVYNAMVREIAAADHLPLCDLAGAIPRTPEYFIDWCHLAPKGEEAVAARWFETIRRAGWFSPGG